MTRPKLLDLFCGAGGAARGYQQAGFHVTGVDIVPQPHYAGDVFIQADALEYVAAHGREFDAIHASPPCQAYSEATPMAYRGAHPDLIDPTRALLIASGRPYVIENVAGARRLLHEPLMLCGSMFGLPLWRHRYFEIRPTIFGLLSPCDHRRAPIAVHFGSHTRNTWIPILCSGGGDGQRANRKLHRPRETVAVIRWAMEIDWMTQAELTEAIPPAYTRWIGERLRRALEVTP